MIVWWWCLMEGSIFITYNYLYKHYIDYEKQKSNKKAARYGL